MEQCKPFCEVILVFEIVTCTGRAVANGKEANLGTLIDDGVCDCGNLYVEIALDVARREQYDRVADVLTASFLGMKCKDPRLTSNIRSDCNRRAYPGTST